MLDPLGLSLSLSSPSSPQITQKVSPRERSHLVIDDAVSREEFVMRRGGLPLREGVSWHMFHVGHIATGEPFALKRYEIKLHLPGQPPLDTRRLRLSPN